MARIDTLPSAMHGAGGLATQVEALKVCVCFDLAPIPTLLG